MSPIPNFEENEFVSKLDSNLTETNVSFNSNLSNSATKRISEDKPDDTSYCFNDNKTVETMEGKCIDFEINATGEDCADIFGDEQKSGIDMVHRVHSVNAINVGTAGEVDNNLPRDTSSDALSEARVTSSITQIANIDPELCGMPLSLFTKVRKLNVLRTFTSAPITIILKFLFCFRVICVYHTYLCHTWIC